MIESKKVVVMEVDVTKFGHGDMVEHYIFGPGTVVVNPVDYPDQFWVSFTSGNWRSFYNNSGKYDPAEVRHGFIAHTPAKRKKTAEVEVWVNVYKYSFPATPSTEENHFAIHTSEDGAVDNAGSCCVAVAVPSKLIIGEWEE